MVHVTFFKGDPKKMSKKAESPVKMRKANKYKAVKQTYKDVSYHSKMEAEYAWELDQRIKAKDIKSWKGQVKIELYAHNKKICNYYIDFVVTHNDGSEEYVEVKGFETDVWRLKWKLFEANYPHVKKTIIK